AAQPSAIWASKRRRRSAPTCRGRSQPTTPLEPSEEPSEEPSDAPPPTDLRAALAPLSGHRPAHLRTPRSGSGPGGAAGRDPASVRVPAAPLPDSGAAAVRGG